MNRSTALVLMNAIAVFVLMGRTGSVDDASSVSFLFMMINRTPHDSVAVMIHVFFSFRMGAEGRKKINVVDFDVERM